MDSFLMDYGQPTAEDRKRARQLGLLQFGLALMGAPKGRELQAIGNAGLLGVAGYNQDLRDTAEERRLNIGTRRMQQQMEYEAAQRAEQQRMAAGMESARQGAIIPGQQAMPEYGPPTAAGAMQPPVAAQPEGFDLSRYAQSVMKVNPMAGVQLAGMLQKETPYDKPKPEHYTPESLAAFGRSRNPADLVVAPKDSEQWIDIPSPPGSRDGQQWQQSKVTGQKRAVGAVAPVTTVNVGAPRIQGAEESAKGALNVKNYGAVQEQATQAQKELAILYHLQKNPLETGAGVPITATAANWLSYAGMGGDAVKKFATDSQTFTRDAMDLVLTKQLAQKGPQTESDAKRLEQTVANARNTREANAAIIDFSIRQAKRTVEMRNHYDKWWKDNRTYEGADAAWFEGKGAQSLYDDSPQGGQRGGRQVVDTGINKRTGKRVVKYSDGTIEEQ